MRTRTVGLALALFIPLALFSLADGAELSIKVHEFVCRDGHYLVRFGVINTYTYNPQPIVAFKIIRNGQILDCKTTNLDVAPGEDGSPSYRVIFELSCGQDEAPSLQYLIFDRRARNRVGIWLGDCPSKAAPPTK